MSSPQTKNMVESLLKISKDKENRDYLIREQEPIWKKRVEMVLA